MAIEIGIIFTVVYVFGLIARRGTHAASASRGDQRARENLASREGRTRVSDAGECEHRTWYIIGQTRTCAQCGRVEFRERHRGEWRYFGQDSEIAAAYSDDHS